MNQKVMNKTLFVLGILLALTGATLMFFGILPIASRILIGVVGLLLIATSQRKLKKL